MAPLDASPNRAAESSQGRPSAHRDPAARHALAVEDCQERLDARCAVADGVERDAAGGLGLLDRDAIRHVVGRHEVERSVGEPRPHRVAIGGRSKRRRDEVASATDRIRFVVFGVGEHEVMRARLRCRPDAGGLRPANLVEGGGGGQVDDVDRRLRLPGERERAGGRHGLDVGRSRRSVVAR
jgi:hypothetical protein